jgi:leukotriene-A4 hydrolase
MNYGINNSYSSLYPVLNGASPDDSFSQLPYEKGFQFLTYLETLVGDSNFQTFVRNYIKKYSLQSVTYLDLKSTWEDFVNQNYNATDAASILS